jgi:hypothetical protein
LGQVCAATASGDWAVSCGNSGLIAPRHRAKRQGKGVRAILKSLGRALVLSAAAASVVGLAAAPALAATTWTVKPGGAVTAKAGKTTVNDVTAGLSVTCTSSTAKGTLKSGSGLAGKALGTFSSLAFAGCTTSGVSISVTIKAKMPLNGVSYNKTTKVASMTITGIHGKLSISSPVSCSAVINGTSATANNGTVKATFTNKTNTLKVLTTGSNLHLYNDTCPVTASGDAVNFTGSYKFMPKQTITSP